MRLRYIGIKLIFESKSDELAVQKVCSSTIVVGKRLFRLHPQIIVKL